MRTIGLALAVVLVSGSSQSPAGLIGFPKASEGDLDNGLHLIILEQNDKPFVSFQLSIPGAGGYYDADDSKLLARATAELMRERTRTRSSSEITAELENMEGQIWVDAHSTSREAKIWGRCPVEHATKLLDLATDMLLHPVFADEDVGRYKERLGRQLAQPLADPMDLAFDTFYGLVHTNRTAADLESDLDLDRITRENIAEFHRTRYAPDHAVLAVAGDVSPFAAKFFIRQKLGGWKKLDIEPPPVWDPETDTKPRIVLIPRPGLAEPTVVARSQPVARTNKDYEVLEIMNWAAIAIGQLPLHVQQNEGALDEILRLHELQIDADELAEAKRALIDSHTRSLDSPVINQHAIDRWREQLPPDYWETYEQRVNTVTIEQVEAAARKYLAPERLQIVVTGDPEQVTGPLQKLGPVEVLSR